MILKNVNLFFFMIYFYLLEFVFLIPDLSLEVHIAVFHKTYRNMNKKCKYFSQKDFLSKKICFYNSIQSLLELIIER